jgi:hypothetical protein
MECQNKQGETGAQNDPAAKELLRRAYEKTSRWGDSFPGFKSDLVLNDNGETYKGKATVVTANETSVTLEAPAEKESLLQWAQNQVGMMATHRASRPFDAADGKYAITFGEENANHPLGRQILIHGDGMNSRYRIKEDRIRQIDRTTPRMRFTINIEAAMTTSDGKCLTTEYVVYYFAADGNLSRVESFTDRPLESSCIYLPGYRRIISNDAGAIFVRTLQFSNHQLLTS